MLKPILLFLTVISLALIACNSSATKENDTTSSEETTTIDYSKKYPNALIIKEKAAIILNLSAADIDSMMNVEKLTEEALDEAGADIGYYNGIATEELQKGNIKVIQTDKEQIVCVQEDGTVSSLYRKALEGDMIFFDPTKKPLVTHTSNFNDDLPFLGVKKKSNKFQEGFWVQALNSDPPIPKYDTYIQTYFNNGDEMFIKIIENGEFVLEVQVNDDNEDAVYDHVKRKEYFQFWGDELTYTNKKQERVVLDKTTQDRVNEVIRK